MEDDTKDKVMQEPDKTPVEAAPVVVNNNVVLQAVTPNPTEQHDAAVLDSVAQDKQPEAVAASPVPPVPEKQKPTMIVQFDGVDSGHIEMRMIGFDPRLSNFQLSMFAQYLQARCNFGWSIDFEADMARNIAQRQMQAEAQKSPAAAAARKAGLVVPPPGVKMPPR